MRSPMRAPSREAVKESLRCVIRPIVRFCSRRGLSLGDVIEVLKEAFVEEAQRTLEESGDSANASRIAILTGVHRADVTRVLRGETNRSESPSILIRVISEWQDAKPFVTKDGKPKPLSYEGTESEFCSLVASVSREISPYTVLRELERIEAVQFRNNLVELHVTEYVPRGDFTEGMGMVGSDIHFLVCAAEENLLSEKSPAHLHLKTEYDNIVEEALPTIRRWFLEEGAKFHARARSFLRRFDADTSPRLGSKKASARAVIGTFSYCAPHIEKIVTRTRKPGRKKAR